MFKKLLVLIVLLPALATSQTEKKIDVWQPLNFLEGKWEAVSEISTVTQEYQFILNRKFIQMKTKAVFRPSEKKPEGEVHEDLGIFSYDQLRKKYILRGFYIEGFVNQYVLDSISDDGKTFTFVSEQMENAPSGTKAKLIFKVINNDEIEQGFHVAWPGKEFSCYSLNKLKRKK